MGRAAKLREERKRAGRFLAGITIRPAGPADIEAIDELLVPAHTKLLAYQKEALETHGTLGWGLESRMAFANAMVNGPEFAAASLMTVWVAEADGEAVGCLVAGPAERVMDDAMGRSGADPKQIMLRGFIGLVKLHGIAVREDYRKRGLARELLRRLLEVYRDKMLLFGQFEVQEKLGPFYRKAGFSVLTPHDGLRLQRIFGANVVIGPDQGEQFFYRAIKLPGEAGWDYRGLLK